MAYSRSAVHRTIVVVDVEGFGRRGRTNPHQVAIRGGLYRALKRAFRASGIRWARCYHEDRGDGVLILARAKVPKGRFVESLPRALAAALGEHNRGRCGEERIRLRMAVHAGEVRYDKHGVTGVSVNLASRLAEAPSLKEALAGSPGVLAVIASSWFFDEVVRQSPAIDPASYRQVQVVLKETKEVGWICLPDYPADQYQPESATAPVERSRGPAQARAASRVALATIALATLTLGLATNMASATIPRPWQPWGWSLLAILALVTFRAYTWRARTARGGADPLQMARWRLGQEVRKQWVREAMTRGVWRPDPLRVRWSSTRRPVAPYPSAVLDDASLDDLRVKLTKRGDTTQLVAPFRRLPRRQAVVLGEPGSGKTVLALLLTLGLLDQPEPGEPVPVLLSMSSWDPARENLLAWFGRRLAEDYSFLGDTEVYGRRAADEMVAAGLVMPVLDGLDEMPGALHGAAIEGLDSALGNRPFLVTCRSQEYEMAVATGGQILSGAAVAELEPVDVDDIAAFLAATPPAGERWRPVLDHIHTHRDGNLASVLSTPLMVSLARSVYLDPARNPAELLAMSRSSGRDAVAEHLFDEFIPVVYRAVHPAPPGPAEKARADYSTEEALRWHTFLASNLDRTGSPDLAWWRLAQAAPRQLALALGVTNGLAVAVPLGLWLGAVAGPASGLMFALTFGPAAGIAAGIGAVVGGTVTAAGRGHEPRRLRFGLRGVGRLLALGVRFGLPVGILGAMTLVGPLMLSGSASSLLLGLTVTGGSVVVFALAFEADTSAHGGRLSAATPSSVLRSDRTARLVLALLVALTAGLALVKTVSPAFGLASGVAIGLASAANSTYGRFVLIRLCLGCLRQTPFRLMTFLDDAHRRGVLRRVGAVYQFRHDHLRRRLAYLAAERHPVGRGSAYPDQRADARDHGHQRGGHHGVPEGESPQQPSVDNRRRHRLAGWARSRT
jgi:hypothetical protein